jgi:S1-C subfamily serine protease
LHANEYPQEQLSMTTLQTLSNEMATLVETTGASVVKVNARRRLAATGIIMSEDGVIVTSHHVVTRDENIHVTLPDGTVKEATLVGRDPSTDTAVLKVDATGLTTPNWQPSSAAAVGHLVLALGRPGKTVQATLGVVSALGDSWQSPGGGKVDRYFQTDVVMYPGFSGGPLVGADGAVFGMNTSALHRGTSLTVPTETVQRVAEALLKDGHIKRGYLGVTAQTVRLQESAPTDQETGLMIVGIEDGSPAAAGGVLQGDVMISVAGTPTRSMEELLALLSGAVVGEQAEIALIRGGQIESVTVTIGERP